MTPHPQDPRHVLVTFLAVMVCSIVLSMCSIRFGHAADRPILPHATRPMTVIPPSGQPSFIHPSPSPSGPAVILTPNAGPIYVHPPTSPYGPSTIITPNEGSIYVWPGVQ